MNDEFALSALEQYLVNDFQRDLPLVPRPFKHIADTLGIGEDEVLDMLRRLKAGGVVSRVGPVFTPNHLGVSTLAAIAVPPKDLTRVAALVGRYPEVNHNYERDHRYNLWFVIAARDHEHLGKVIDDIASRTALPVLELPMLEAYFIDLGFRIDFGSDHG